MRYKVRKLYACKLIPEGTIINQEAFDELDIFKKAFKPIKEKINKKIEITVHNATYFLAPDFNYASIKTVNDYGLFKKNGGGFIPEEMELIEDSLNDIPNKKHLKEFSKYCEKVIGRDKLYIQDSLIDDFINEKNKPND